MAAFAGVRARRLIISFKASEDKLLTPLLGIGSYIEAGVIAGVIGLNIVVGFVQEFKVRLLFLQWST